MVELLVVVVILGILTALVVPKYGALTEDARAAALQAELGGVRAAIAAFRTESVIAGSAAYPTLNQLLTSGAVMQSPMPTNPFNNLATVQAVSRAQAEARAVVNPQTYGWNYFVDNASTPAVAIFYANSSNSTVVMNGNGQTRAANTL